MFTHNVFMYEYHAVLLSISNCQKLLPAFYILTKAFLVGFSCIPMG